MRSYKVRQPKVNGGVGSQNRRSGEVLRSQNRRSGEVRGSFGEIPGGIWGRPGRKSGKIINKKDLKRNQCECECACERSVRS